MQKYDFNRNFFEVINTQEKAYVLGFLYADGCNTMKSITFNQLEQDVDILEQIVDCLDGDNILYASTQPNGKIKYTLSFNSIKLCEDAKNLGVPQNKSLKITLPDFLSDELMRHFIRGYFDGNGCIWNGKPKIYRVKKDKSCGYRDKVVHNVKFTITGNTIFITQLQEYLIEKIKLTKTKLNFSKAKGNKHVCTMEYSGKKQVEKFYKYLYKDAFVYGNRKKEKFEEIICALDKRLSSETRLIAGTPEMVISSQADNSEGSTTIPEMGVESSDSKCLAPTSNIEDEDIVCSCIK